MQENNFEKRVQEKLDELRLTPSEPVWQNIEVAIRKKKERRLVFWLLPFFLATGGLIWWQAATWQNEKVVQQPVAKTPPEPEQTFSKPHIDPQSQINSQSRSNSINRKARSNNITTAHRQTSIKIKAPEKKKVLQNRIQNQKSENSTTAARTESKRDNIIKGSSEIADVNTNAAVIGSVENITSEQKTKASIKTDSVVDQDTLQKAKRENTDSLQKPILHAIQKTPKKLQWSIVGRIGVSNSVEPLLNGFGSKESLGLSQYPSADYTNGGSSGVGIPGNGSAYRAPATPTIGLQFSVGTAIKKGIGKRSFVTAGLQYSYYSYQLAVGTELSADTLIAQNRSTGQKAFRNNGEHNKIPNTFHVLELPIGFEYQLLKKIPLHVQHGLSISQLLSSRVLQYDYFSNNYYQQSAGLRKTAINVFTAVAYTVWNGKAVSLQAGPHVQYGLQSVFKNSANNHLLSGGLGITMDF